MKTILKLLLLTLCILVASGTWLFNLASKGKLDKELQFLAKIYLNFHDINPSFNEFHFENGELSINEALFSYENFKLKISNLNIAPKITKENWSNIKVTTLIKEGYISAILNDQEILAESILHGKIENNLIQNKYSYDIKLNDINTKMLRSGTGSYKSVSDNDIKFTKFNIDFANDTYFNFIAREEEKIKLDVNINNWPIVFYKILSKILPNNGFLTFCEDFIKSGNIRKGNISGQLQKDFNLSNLNEKELQGYLKLDELDLLYHNDLPQIKDIDADVYLRGSKINIDINSAKSTEIDLFNGKIDIIWKGIDDTKILINAKGEGPSRGLTDFIDLSAHDVMNQVNIDLRQIKGIANIDVNVTIPLKPGTINEYDISAKIDDAELKIFKNNINLANAKIQGFFDGNQIVIDTKGKINGFNSQIDFVYNLEDNSEFDHKLSVKSDINLSTNHTKNLQISSLSFSQGKTTVNTEYIYKNDSCYINLDSNLDDINLSIDKLGISKKKGEKGNLSAKIYCQDITKADLDFIIKGNNKLNITGSGVITQDKYQIIFDKIAHKNTNISGSISEDDNSLNINLKGQDLDLSDSNMIYFLQKEYDNKKTKINLNFKTINLKNNINFTNFAMNLNCDENKCFTGGINSKIGSDDVSMSLTSTGIVEKWLINSTDAGSLFKALGMYGSLKNGNFKAELNTTRKETKSGKVIPIHDGNFSLKNFEIENVPFVTKLISSASLTGFLSTISGNNNIPFRKMSGDFSFENNILSVHQSSAEGDFFNFTLQGYINTQSRLIDINGYVKPHIIHSQVTKAVGFVPIIGTIISGDKKRGGLISTPYNLQEKY